MLDRRVPGLLRRPQKGLAISPPRGLGGLKALNPIYFRRKLAANTSFFVRTDGNDNNDGLSDTSAGAWLTLQGATNNLYRRWDFGSFTPTVNVRAGTFAPLSTAHPWIGGSYPHFVGAGVGSSIIAATGNSQSLVTARDFTVLGIDGFSLSAGGFAGVIGLDCSQGGVLDFTNVSFGAMSVGARCNDGGYINQLGNFTIAGNLAAFVQSFHLGRVDLTSTITVNGGLTIDFFLNVQNNGIVNTGGVAVAFAGAGAGAGTTGQKFITASGGRIDDAGTTWPGATAGTKAHVDGPSAPVSSGALARFTDTTGNNVGAADAAQVAAASAAATEAAQGAVELATNAETVTGTDNTRAVHPAGLTARLAAPGNIGGTTPAIGTFTAVSLTQGQLAFPATQNPAADANTLDDYEEGTWTPVLTFATPGNLNVVYSIQSADYTKIGRDVRIASQTLTSTFTHTTASGGVKVTGLPFTSANTTHSFVQSTAWQGITKATYTQVAAFIIGNVAEVLFFAFGSGVGVSQVVAADMPTGGNVNLAFGGPYRV